MEASTKGIVRLIVNADDFGLAPGINQAVAKLHSSRRLTSTSLVVNSPWSEEAIAFAIANPDLRVGLHLNLSTYKPLLPPEKVPSLVNSDGTFLRASTMLVRLITRRVDMGEMAAEMAAQMAAYLGSGIQRAHLDTHMHLHAIPEVGNLVADLARQNNVKIIRNIDPVAMVLPPVGESRQLRRAIRRPVSRLMASTKRLVGAESGVLGGEFKCADQVIYLRWCVGQGKNVAKRFNYCVRQLGGESAEIVAHPAVEDDVLATCSNYVSGRQIELAFLLSEQFARLMEQGEFSLDLPERV